MRGATACQVSHCRSIPLAIKASCRGLQLIMAVPEPHGSRRRKQLLLYVTQEPPRRDCCDVLIATGRRPPLLTSEDTCRAFAERSILPTWHFDHQRTRVTASRGAGVGYEPLRMNSGLRRIISRSSSCFPIGRRRARWAVVISAINAGRRSPVHWRSISLSSVI